MARTGPVSSFTPEVGAQICDQLSGGTSLTAICAAPGMPDRSTVRRWLADPANAAFRHAYDSARLSWCDELFEEIAELGEEARRAAEAADAKGGNAAAAVAAIREEIRAKMWVCSKLRPELYGDRAAIEVTGRDGRDLFPAARIPALMQVLQILMPDAGNTDLHELARSLVERLGPGVPALSGGNG